MQKTRFTSRESGALAFNMALLISVGIFGGTFLLKNSFFASYQQGEGLSANQIASNAMSKVKSLLIDKVRAGACTSENNTFRDFRVFEKASPKKMKYTLANSGCFLTATEKSKLQSFEMTILELNEDVETLTKHVDISISLRTQQKRHGYGKVDKRRLVRLRIPSLGDFSAVFLSGSPSLYASNGPTTIFTGSTLHASNSPMRIEDIATGDSFNRLKFSFPFYTMASRFRASRGGARLGNLNSTFPRGFQYSVLDSTAVNVRNYLPNNSTAWNHRFDAGYLVNEGSFPYLLPEVPGRQSFESCEVRGQPFRPFHGNISRIPDPTRGINTLGFFCGEDTLAIPTFLHYRRNSNFQIDYSSSDRAFCAQIVAKELRISLPSSAPNDYVFFGSIAVERVIVTGHKDSRIFFHNPYDNISVIPNLESTLTGNQSQSNMTTQLKKLSSSVAWNFATPFTSADPVFRPRSPAQYLRPCGGNQYAFFPEYIPMHELPAYNTMLKNPDKNLFIVEDIQ